MIYCISGDMEISTRQNFRKNRWKSPIFPYISVIWWYFTDFSQFFQVVNTGQHMLQWRLKLAVKGTWTPNKRLKFAIEGTWTPNKRLTWSLAYPCLIYCTKHVYIEIHQIKQILKEYFREQNNYNYFIIK